MKTEIVEVHILMNGQRGGFDVDIHHTPKDGKNATIVTKETATGINDALAVVQNFSEKHT